MPFVVYQFGDFSLHCGKFELCRNGRRLKLERKPLELLVFMVTRHGQVVTRDEIAECLWGPEVFVDIEHGINTELGIRQILGDSSDLPQFVQTISGSGYRFIGTLLRLLSRKSPSQRNLPGIQSTCLLLYRRSPLSPHHQPNHIPGSGRSLPCVSPCSLPFPYSPSARIRWLPASSIEILTLRSPRSPFSPSTISPAIRIRSTSPTA